MKAAISNIIEKNPTEAPLLINFTNFLQSTLAEILSLISSLTCSPICARLMNQFGRVHRAIHENENPIATGHALRLYNEKERRAMLKSIESIDTADRKAVFTGMCMIRTEMWKRSLDCVPPSWWAFIAAKLRASGCRFFPYMRGTRRKSMAELLFAKKPVNALMFIRSCVFYRDSRRVTVALRAGELYTASDGILCRAGQNFFGVFAHFRYSPNWRAVKSE